MPITTPSYIPATQRTRAFPPGCASNSEATRSSNTTVTVDHAPLAAPSKQRLRFRSSGLHPNSPVVRETAEVCFGVGFRMPAGRDLSTGAAAGVRKPPRKEPAGAGWEHADWETAHHVFTFANAVHQALKRIGSEPADSGDPIEAVRGLLHGAMALYLARYLN